MTSIDSFRPSILNVTIDLSSFTNAAPADGAIDPITVQKYEEMQVQTGTVANPTVTDGDTIEINDISITFTTAGGLTLTGIIATINALTDQHHMIAQNDGSNHLQLIHEAWYETYGMTTPESGGATPPGSIIVASPAVLAELGFNPPTITYPYSAGSDTLAHAEAKSRGNSRWNFMMKLLGFEATPVNVGSIRMTGNTINAAPSSISFSVTYRDFQSLYTYDELNNNALLKGIPALTRMIARVLIADRFEIRDVIDPTVVSGENTIGDKLMTLEIGALEDNLPDAESVITITPIALTR